VWAAGHITISLVCMCIVRDAAGPVLDKLILRSNENNWCNEKNNRYSEKNNR